MLFFSSQAPMQFLSHLPSRRWQSTVSDRLLELTSLPSFQRVQVADSQLIFPSRAGTTFSFQFHLNANMSSPSIPSHETESWKFKHQLKSLKLISYKKNQKWTSPGAKDFLRVAGC